MYTIIFDWKRTLYDPDSKTLISGTLNLLKFLCKKNVKNILIGKGGDKMFQEVKRLKIEKYFSKIIFHDVKRDIKSFSQFVSAKNLGLTIVVGDRVQSEIEIGNRLKTITIWLKQGKFSEELPSNKFQEPLFTINSINELLVFFKNKLKKRILV